MQICPNCGEENPARFRLCGFCGSELVAVSIPRETRRMVTVVFCDLKGSTDLAEKLDTESLREVLAHYFAEMSRILERHGGRVEKYIGDAIMAVFGVPRAHEDDALRAVRAAAEMQQALGGINGQLLTRWGVTLANRTGVNSGEVIAGDIGPGQRLVTGDVVNVAARLEQAAPEMEILIGASTHRLVRSAVEVEPLEPLTLKGKADPVPAFRLLSVSTSGTTLVRDLDVPMVGRVDELALLQRAFERTVGDSGCLMVTVVGDAGVGKSRLIHEFLNQAGGSQVLRTRCLPYGEGITFWPLAELVRQAAGIGSEDDPEQARSKLARLVDEAAFDRLVAAVGLSAETFPLEETFWGLRHLLETLARERTVIAVVEDIHWAEPALLDLIELTAGSLDRAPVLLLCSARHDLFDERRGWGGVPGASRIDLSPLSGGESSLILDRLLGPAALPGALRERIIGASEGNPLFVEQMISMLIDDGKLSRDGSGRWSVQGGSEELDIPPSIFALLAARLDRLSPDERATIERAAVVGPIFYGEAVAALSPQGAGVQVDRSLEALTERGLIRPDRSGLAREDAFRFNHILIRDAVYQGLLKRDRIELHERVADWLEVTGGSLMEHEEMVGYHLEHCYGYRTELGPADQEAAAVGHRAAQKLSAAGRRAFARGDMRAAANLLGRAAPLLEKTDPLRVSFLPDLGEALMDIGEFERADDLLGEGIEGASLLGDHGLEQETRIVRLLVRDSMDPQARAETFLAEAEGAIPVLEEFRHHSGLARAWRLIALVHGTAGRYGAAEAALHRVIDYARIGGDKRQETRNLPNYALCALYGPMPIEEAIARCDRLLEEATGDQRAEALVESALAQLHAMQGRFDRARDLCRRSRTTLLDLGERVLGASRSLDSSRVELLADNPAAAEAELRVDFEALSGMGETYYLSGVAALLSHALYLQGRHEEAEAFTRISETAGDEDVEDQSLWRRARAKVLASRGSFEEAERLAREAERLVSGTDSPVLRANTLMDLAVVLRLTGRPTEAAHHAGQALDLFEGKGNIVGAARARGLLSEVAPPPSLAGRGVLEVG